MAHAMDWILVTE